MLLTELILIKPNHSHHKGVKALCREKATITNQAIYYFRQAFFNHEHIKWAQVDKLMKSAQALKTVIKPPDSKKYHHINRKNKLLNGSR